MTHECKHEYDWGEVKAHIATTQTDVAEIKKFMLGDNGEGWMQELSATKESVKNLWYFLGTLVTLLLAGVGLWAAT